MAVVVGRSTRSLAIMKQRMWPILFIVALVACVAAGIALRSWVWGGVAIFMAALLLNGFIATLEDDLAEGGASEGAVSPRYVRITAWTVRGIGVIAAVATVWMLWLAKASQSA